MQLNFIQWNGFTFLFRIEKWNKDENPYELRLYILWWELNFDIKNNKHD